MPAAGSSSTSPTRTTTPSSRGLCGWRASRSRPTQGRASTSCGPTVRRSSRSLTAATTGAIWRSVRMVVCIALRRWWRLGRSGSQRPDPQSLLGKILRLDVSVGDDDPTGYRVPGDNPFVGRDGVRSEIWDAGLRNPWRYSFDDPARGGTGALIVADVGQDHWEEIDYEPAGRGGRNYKAGAIAKARTSHHHALSVVRAADRPIYQYSHDGSAHAIIGGYVYRGSALAQTSSDATFGDFMTGRLWSVRLDVDPISGEASAGDLGTTAMTSAPSRSTILRPLVRTRTATVCRELVSWHGLPPGGGRIDHPADVRPSHEHRRPAARGQSDSRSDRRVGARSCGDDRLRRRQRAHHRLPGRRHAHALGQVQVFARRRGRGVRAAVLTDRLRCCPSRVGSRSLPDRGFRCKHRRARGVARTSVEVDVLPGHAARHRRPPGRRDGSGPVHAQRVGARPLGALGNWRRRGPHLGVSGERLRPRDSSRRRPTGGAVRTSPRCSGRSFSIAAGARPRPFSIRETGRLSCSCTRARPASSCCRSKCPSTWPTASCSGGRAVAGGRPAAVQPSLAGRTSRRGCGVDAVHVWAFPVDGSPPLFLGYSALGGWRPDVAAAFGARFAGSGFIVPFVLPPGAFDLCVFAHRRRTDSFDAVRVVRVNVN